MVSRTFASIVVVATALVFGLVGSSTAGEPAKASGGCRSPLISTVNGCKGPAAVSKKLDLIVRQSKQANFLRAVVARVDVAGKTLLRRGYGDSQTDVPAAPNMNFRVGSMTIPVLTSVVYQLRDEGKLTLDRPISKWLPAILPGDDPDAHEQHIRLLRLDPGE